MSLVAFVGGVLFGTAGIGILKSDDAKKVYTHCTAAVLRGKDSVCDTLTTLKENCDDIHADAKDINEQRLTAAEELKLAQAKAIIAEYENRGKEEPKEEPKRAKKVKAEEK